MDNLEFMNGVIKQEACEEFFKAFEDARMTGEGYLRMEYQSDGVIKINHIPEKDISINIPLVLQCPSCLLGGEWKVNGECIRCGY